MVVCTLGCLPLPLEYLVPPPGSEVVVHDVHDGTLLEEGGTQACEGDEPDEPAGPIEEDDLPW